MTTILLGLLLPSKWASGSLQLPPRNWVESIQVANEFGPSKVVGSTIVDSTSLQALLAPFASVGLAEPYVKLRGKDGTEMMWPKQHGTVEGLGELFRGIRGGNNNLTLSLPPVMSAIFQLELLEISPDLDIYLQQLLGDDASAHMIDGTWTAHLYVSAPGAAALSNHTDTTDIAVFQLGGSKRWFTCDTREIRESGISQKFSKCASYSDAEMSIVQREAQGACRSFTMAPGDALLLPRGMLHSARVGSDSKEASVHFDCGHF